VNPDDDLHRELARLTYLQQAFDDAGTGSWTLDLGSGEGWWSPQMHAVMGTDPAGPAPTHGTYLSQIHPDDLPASTARAADMKAGRISFDRSRFRILTPAGVVRWVDATVQLMRDPDGAPAVLCGTVTDITDAERIQAERVQALADLAMTSAENRRRGELLEEAQRVAGIGSWAYEAETGRMTWSATMREILGVGADEPLTPDLFLAMVHPDDQERLATLSGEALSRGESSELEHRVVRPDGQERVLRVRARAEYWPDAGLRRMHGTAQDVTDAVRLEAERRAALAALAAREEMLQEAQRIAGVGSWIVDLDSGTSLWSPELHRIFGSTAPPDEPVRHEAFLERVHPDDREEASDRVLRALAGEQDRWEFEHRIVRLDGTERVVLTRGYIDRDGTGVTSLRGTAHDITAREQAEQQLRRAMDEAVAANAAKSAFLATMSHEIRTPMNAVIGLTGLLLDTDLDPQQRDLLQTVRSSGDQLLAVINDVLDFSKIEAGELDLESRPFDLHEVVEGSVAQFAGVAHDLELRARVEPGCPVTVLGDVTRLRQVLANLVGNAVKFTAHGTVEVVAGRVDGDLIRFRVRDTGIGIPATAMDRLFESFSQVDASTTRVYGGSGLGLAISRALVEAMGGTIEVESVPGAGSTFTVTVRLATVTDAAATVPAQATARDGNRPTATGLHVLLAEDNEVNQKVGRLLLTKLGHTVDIVANGAEALAAARSGAHDVILMDMHMPVMDGLEATRRIRAEVTGRRPVIIALTASVTLEDREACAAAGMDGYLPKPVQGPDLAAVLIEHVPAAAGRGTTWAGTT
jgi:PAS domain S-box-containing protein